MLRSSRRSFVQNQRLKSICDRDIDFLENLSAEHKRNVQRLSNRLHMNEDMLFEPYLTMYRLICLNYPLIEMSNEKKSVFNNNDLIFADEENLKNIVQKKIEDYLRNNSPYLFNDFIVQLFSNVVMGCEQSQFSVKEQLKLYKSNEYDFSSINCSDVKCISVLSNETNDKILKDENAVANLLLIDFTKRETLLSPFIPMDHSPFKFNTEKIEGLIRSNFSSVPSNKNEKSKVVLSLINNSSSSLRKINELNDKKEQFKESNDNQKNANCNRKTPASFIPMDHPPFKFNTGKNEGLIRSNSSSVPNNNEKSKIALSLINNSSSSLRKINDKKEQFKEFNDNRKNVNCNRKTAVQSPPEVIEISDDDDVNDTLIGDSNTIDADKFIDFLMHRCTVDRFVHPNLLKDYQLKVELNGFLIFVTYAIRLSLRYNIEDGDIHVFRCILICSLVVGLQCQFRLTNNNGIMIERLSYRDYQIISSRLRSLQIYNSCVEHNNKFGYSVLVNMDVRSLIQLAIYYIQSYRQSGQLVEVKIN